MESARIVETVDVFKYGDFYITTRSPRSLPQRFSLDRLEDRLDVRVIIAVVIAAHRHLETMLAQDFLATMRAVLAAPVSVIDTALQWPAQGNGPVQRSDRQIAFHPVADGQPDHPA